MSDETPEEIKARHRALSSKLSPEDEAAKRRITGDRGQHKPLSVVTDKRRVPFSELVRRGLRKPTC